MILYDVHTVAEPIRHFQQYPDPLQAQRMAEHHAAVLHEPMVVEPVVEPEPTTVYRIVAARKRRRRVETVDAGRCDPDDLDDAMSDYQRLFPGWALRAIPEKFTGPATTETPGRGGYGTAPRPGQTLSVPTVPTVPKETQL